MSHTSPPDPADPSLPRVDPPATPALRRTIIRPVLRPDPVDAAYVATRLSSLTHDLANLLEGSLRVVALARRSVDSSPECDTTTDPVLLSKQLDTLHAAMQQMAGLVRDSMVAMNRGGIAQTNIRAPFGSGGPLSEGIIHAVEVMRPLADERAITLTYDIDPALCTLNCGPMYTVIANGIRNALESIHLACAQSPPPVGHDAGRIHVKAWTEPTLAGPSVVIEIADDGVGPPEPGAGGATNVFHPGFTTKPGNTGLGLAISLDVVNQLGGTIQLHRRPTNLATGRGGAILRVCYPTAGISDRFAKSA